MHSLDESISNCINRPWSLLKMVKMFGFIRMCIKVNSHPCAKEKNIPLKPYEPWKFGTFVRATQIHQEFTTSPSVRPSVHQYLQLHWRPPRHQTDTFFIGVVAVLWQRPSLSRSLTGVNRGLELWSERWARNIPSMNRTFGWIRDNFRDWGTRYQFQLFRFVSPHKMSFPQNLTWNGYFWSRGFQYWSTRRSWLLASVWMESTPPPAGLRHPFNQKPRQKRRDKPSSRISLDAKSIVSNGIVFSTFTTGGISYSWPWIWNLQSHLIRDEKVLELFPADNGKLTKDTFFVHSHLQVIAILCKKSMPERVESEILGRET